MGCTKYVGFAAFAILIWDHIDTFPDEVLLTKFQLAVNDNNSFIGGIYLERSKKPMCVHFSLHYLRLTVSFLVVYLFLFVRLS